MLIGILISSFIKYLFKLLLILKTDLSSYCWVVRVFYILFILTSIYFHMYLYILDINNLLEIANIFPIVACLFIFLKSYFKEKKFKFILCKYYLWSKKSLLMLMSPFYSQELFLILGNFCRYSVMVIWLLNLKLLKLAGHGSNVANCHPSCSAND